MTRPAHILIDKDAIRHNVMQVKHHAPGKKVIAMVKANAYGCGIDRVVPILDEHVDAFGVASLEEALSVRQLGARRDCILIQGPFASEELMTISQHGFQIVIHQHCQLQWLLSTPLRNKIRVWVKVNTGMHRLGFAPDELPDILQALSTCAWVESPIGLMSHLACADEPNHASNHAQFQAWNGLMKHAIHLQKSIANSAAILSFPSFHEDAVRPGIMLYGISPFPHQIGNELGLRPVMHLRSALTAIHNYPPGSAIGYGGTWSSNKPTKIGVVAIGYGDGYPRHIRSNTLVWINGCYAPIVGRVSMDMLTIDLTDCPEVNVGDCVELWGKHVPIEHVALAAGTIAYELLCQVTSRVRRV